MKNKNRIIGISSLSNIFYSFSNIISNLILTPIFISQWGVDLYGEWLLIFFVINGIIFLIQPSITVDSVNLSKIYTNKRYLESIIFFFILALKIIINLLIFLIIFFLIFYFFQKNINIKFTNIQNLEKIAFILFICASLQILQLVFLSLFRSRYLAYKAINILSLRIIILILFSYFLLKNFNFDPLEYVRFLLVIEVFINLILLLLSFNFFLQLSFKKIIKNKKIIKKYLFNKKLFYKKNYMFLFQSSEIMNNNLLPVIIGLYLNSSMIIVYNIHLICARVPRLFTTSLFQAFRLELSQFNGTSLKYNYSLLLLAISFWSCVIYLLFTPFILKFLVSYLSSNQINLDLKIFIFIYLFSSIEILWRSLILPVLTNNTHEKISKNYFFITSISYIFICFFLEFKIITNFNFIPILILQNLLLFFIAFNLFSKVLKKNKIIILNYIFFNFPKLLFKIISKIKIL